MGASDWAGEMIGELEAEFDLSRRQASRVTNLLRQFASNPDYEDVLGRNRAGEYRKHQRTLFEELPVTLRCQRGGTLEERWNNLMDEMRLQDRTEHGVYLEPWTEETKEAMGDLTRTELPGVYRR